MVVGDSGRGADNGKRKSNQCALSGAAMGMGHGVRRTNRDEAGTSSRPAARDSQRLNLRSIWGPMRGL